jgi:uncharacterized protein YukE
MPDQQDVTKFEKIAGIEQLNQFDNDIAFIADLVRMLNPGELRLPRVSQKEPENQVVEISEEMPVTVEGLQQKVERLQGERQEMEATLASLQAEVDTYKNLYNQLYTDTVSVGTIQYVMNLEKLRKKVQELESLLTKQNTVDLDTELLQQRVKILENAIEQSVGQLSGSCSPSSFAKVVKDLTGVLRPSQVVPNESKTVPRPSRQYYTKKLWANYIDDSLVDDSLLDDPWIKT